MFFVCFLGNLSLLVKFDAIQSSAYFTCFPMPGTVKASEAEVELPCCYFVTVLNQVRFCATGTQNLPCFVIAGVYSCQSPSILLRNRRALIHAKQAELELPFFFTFVVVVTVVFQVKCYAIGAQLANHCQGPFAPYQLNLPCIVITRAHCHRSSACQPLPGSIRAIPVELAMYCDYQGPL